MNNEFLERETSKIYQDEKFQFPLNLAMVSAWIMGNFKGTNLKIYNVEKSSSLTDYYVICSAQNMNQARAIADTISMFTKNQGEKVLSFEGKNESDWLLLDLKNVIVHIFLENARDKYALDELYKNASAVSIPESYYFSGPEMKTNHENIGQYF